jgi:hypothetical protein
MPTFTFPVAGIQEGWYHLRKKAKSITAPATVAASSTADAHLTQALRAPHPSHNPRKPSISSIDEGSGETVTALNPYISGASEFNRVTFPVRGSML